MGSVISSAIVSGCIYALLSLGFALGFRVSRVFNLAHGGLLVTAAYLNFGFAQYFSLSPWLAIPAAIALSGSIGFALDGLAIPWVKEAGLKPVDILLLSWLFLVVLQNLLIIVFSNSSIYMGAVAIQPGWPLLGTRITTLQLVIVFVSISAGTALYALSRWTATGREVAAVGDDARLALICGINVRRIVALNAAASGVVTAAAGVLLSYQERMDPALGIRFSIIAIISTLVGTPLGPAGAVVGAIAFALFESLVLYLVDPGLRNSAVYLCLLAIVLAVYRRQTLPEQ